MIDRISILRAEAQELRRRERVYRQNAEFADSAQARRIDECAAEDAARAATELERLAAELKDTSTLTTGATP